MNKTKAKATSFKIWKSLQDVSAGDREPQSDIEAMAELCKSDFTMLKSFVRPPKPVELVMSAVCILKGVQPEQVNDPNNPGYKVSGFILPLVD